MLVTGPRQVGKTTVLQNCETQPRTYVSLDTLENRELAKNDPTLFLQRYPAPVLIDEIQYAPELFPYIKASVDKEKKNGMYWLTGSQQFHLMKTSLKVWPDGSAFCNWKACHRTKKRASGRSALSADGRIHKNQSTECD